MRSFKPLVLMSLGAATATAESEIACSPGSPSVTTRYVTVPASPVTETVYAASPKLSSGADGSEVSPTLTLTNLVTETIFVPSAGSSSASAAAANVPALTATEFKASTQVIQVTQASSPVGPYSFTEDNGTTTWMGVHTPPASASLVTSTSFVTLQPISTPISEGTSATTITSYVTVSLTLTVTQIHTKTQIGSASAVRYSSKAYTRHGYTGHGASGWNATLTTLVKLKVNPTGTERANPSVYDASTPRKVMSSSGRVFTSPTTPTVSRGPVKPRQLGEVIVATIDGVAVSWTNSYAGDTPTSSEAEPTFVPVTATAPPFGEATSSPPSPSSSLHQINFGPTAAPTTTVGVYPWDLAADITTVTSTSRQPGIVPMPSISTSDIASVLSAILPTRATWSITSAEISSTKYTHTTTGLASAATTANPSCREANAQFTIDFDDLPSFSTGPGDTDIPPIFNPYRKLYWEGHFGYVPPPTDPFPPHSPPQLAVYRRDGANLISSSDAGLELIGGLGSGPRAEYSAYWFDALSAWLGCANGGSDDCTITITGHANGKNNVTTVMSQTVIQPACPELKDCSLAVVEFNEGFRNLTALQIVATVNGQVVDWYMDDLKLSWSGSSPFLFNFAPFGNVQKFREYLSDVLTIPVLRD